MIICFDLDGTLCNTDNDLPVPDRYYKSSVIPHMREVVHRFHSKGHDIWIDTARGSSYTGLFRYIKLMKLKRLTTRQLQQWDIPYNRLRVGIKPPADIFIDDRCIPHTLFTPKDNNA